MDILEYTRTLRTERMNLFDQSKQVVDTAVEAKRGVNAEEQAKLDTIDARIAEIDAAVSAADDRERRERESAVSREAFEREHPTTDTGRRSERQAVDDWLRGRSRYYQGEERGVNAITLNLAAAAREKQAIRSGATPEELRELRSILWDGGASGGSLLVPVTLSTSLYEYLEASMAALRMPTTKINTSSGEAMQFPKVATHGIATQVIAQGTAIGGTDPVFGRIQLDAYKYGQLVQVSSEMIADEVVDILDFVARNMGRALGRLVDADLVVGTGTGEPNGIMTTAGAGAGTVATGGSLITPTYENLVDLVYSVNDEYRASGSAAFLMKDATAGNLRKLRDGAGGTVGAVLWEPSLTAGIQQGQPDRLLGFPVYTDPNVASLASNARIMAFGDFSAYYIRIVGNVVVERSDEYAFNTDLVTFRIKGRWDGDNIDPTTGGAVGAYNLLKQSV